MSRSSIKGPFVDERLIKKVEALKSAGRKEPIKTWSRACQIPPEVHKEVFVTEDMVGHRLGEFSLTRTFRGHGRIVKRTLTKT